MALKQGDGECLLPASSAREQQHGYLGEQEKKETLFPVGEDQFNTGIQGCFHFKTFVEQICVASKKRSKRTDCSFMHRVVHESKNKDDAAGIRSKL